MKAEWREIGTALDKQMLLLHGRIIITFFSPEACLAPTEVEHAVLGLLSSLSSRDLAEEDGRGSSRT